MPAETRLVYRDQLVRKLKDPERHLAEEDSEVKSFSILLGHYLDRQVALPRVAPIHFAQSAFLLAKHIKQTPEEEMKSLLGRKEHRFLVETTLRESPGISAKLMESIPRIARKVTPQDYANEVEKYLYSM